MGRLSLPNIPKVESPEIPHSKPSFFKVQPYVFGGAVFVWVHGFLGGIFVGFILRCNFFWGGNKFQLFHSPSQIRKCSKLLQHFLGEQVWGLRFVGHKYFAQSNHHDIPLYTSCWTPRTNPTSMTVNMKFQTWQRFRSLRRLNCLNESGNFFLCCFAERKPILLLMVEKSGYHHLGNKHLINNWINYQPQLVSRISEPSTVCLRCVDQNLGEIWSIPQSLCSSLPSKHQPNVDGGLNILTLHEQTT